MTQQSDTRPGSVHTERREFVRSYVENVRVNPSADRLYARPRTALMTASLVAAAVLIGSVVFALFSKGRPTAPNAASASPTYAFASIAGWECAGTATDRGFSISGRTPDWLTPEKGAHKQNGCRGSFAAVPVSGAGAFPDANTGAVWWFTVGSKVKRCLVQVNVPLVEQSQVKVASAVRYQVLSGRDGVAYASFVINQAAQQPKENEVPATDQQDGKWVEAGTFAVSNGKLAVRMAAQTDAGKPPERLLVGQVMVGCSP
ncbi:hypothetical protein Val02_45170 [Virgisporangium aliadipatigenens]|uniref:Uncharacterized protein n=1 Tax=Virgisporangium aliadipatigenens TaxID=741659 RepID=A0A8J3YPQ2_9ACTN|nr:hypothetical protein [Virgisporangium aliadipatigenens]GIJ47631.1 hypothetical protein Val02_45170 [Virgisporangium aliadipatigenens]